MDTKVTKNRLLEILFGRERGHNMFKARLAAQRIPLRQLASIRHS